jgi:hypothetical protein
MTGAESEIRIRGENSDSDLTKKVQIRSDSDTQHLYVTGRYRYFLTFQRNLNGKNNENLSSQSNQTPRVGTIYGGFCSYQREIQRLFRLRSFSKYPRLRIL